MSVKKKIIAHLNDRLNDMIPGTPCVGIYADIISKMTDKELESFIEALENGLSDDPDMSKPSLLISIIAPNLDKKNMLSVERNLKLAEKMGHSFFERLWLTNPITGQTTLTNRKYLVMDLPIRRQSQTLDTKISLPENDYKVDDLTGQVTGEAKGSSISYPEIQMLESQGYNAVINELTKARGGDEEAWRVMKKGLIETGEFNLDTLDWLDSRAKVNMAFNNILNGMHIRNNV